jgi:hypothetical protein
MKYIYAKPGYFYPGLPARDLDDSELDDEQKGLLVGAVTQGVYTPVQAGKKSIKGETHATGTEITKET